MDKKSTHSTEKRLGLNGLFVVIALLALYGISCTAIKSWQIYTDEFSGIIELGILSLLISAIWLFMYWFLDRIQHESLKMTLLSFFLGVVAYLAGEGIVSWIIGAANSVFIEDIGLPILAFFPCFAFVVVTLRSFDELVDSFIYGGFLGTGIAFAACMAEFVSYESLDGQFVIIELITRISVYAAICSLSGFLIHQTLLRKKIAVLCFSVILMAVLFALNHGIEQVFMRNIAFSGIEILPVLVSVGFAVVLVAVVAVLIHKILKSDTVSSNSLAIQNTRAPAIIMAGLALAFVLYAFYIRYGEFKTKAFVSANGNWTFRLPAGFTAADEYVSGSIFDFAAPTEDVFYKNQSDSVHIYVFADEKRELDNPHKLGLKNGWEVSSAVNQFVTEDALTLPLMRYQKTYFLRKGEYSILIDVFTDEKQDAEADRAIRVLIKTMEARND